MIHHGTFTKMNNFRIILVYLFADISLWQNSSNFWTVYDGNGEIK